MYKLTKIVAMTCFWMLAIANHRIFGDYAGV